VLTLILDDRIEPEEPIPSPSDHVTEATSIAPDVMAQSAILRVLPSGKAA
jgi:hypothetical protein